MNEASAENPQLSVCQHQDLMRAALSAKAISRYLKESSRGVFHLSESDWETLNSTTKITEN